ncbi:hypothetical protein F0L74_21590 [Chitinophaga agrisoli]|uniref:Uncharacterized protein n=1 Tax=Chitinophaga agrisoli TaxID=2607653 RepID=A0A5B2VJQ2_9BACT|nr:hypothetical protein [Chitinophaga agrisoli]KAA2238810.1 hypothetical protein F0L74_21590 [Chitinophaga agrisoli]
MKKKWQESDISALIEEFEQLLFKNNMGIATEEENCRLSELIKIKEVRAWYYKIRDRYPNAQFKIECEPKRRQMKRIVASIVSLLLFCVLLYAIHLVTKDPTPARKSEHGFYGTPLKDLVTKASKQYGKTIVLDQPQIGDIPVSGGFEFESDIRLDDFLYNSTYPYDLRYYTDSLGVIHISY